MPAPAGHKLVGAWCPPEMAEAVAREAKARGVSRSHVLREALARKVEEEKPRAR